MSSSNVSLCPQPKDIQLTVIEEENIHIEENLLTLIIKLVVSKTRCSSGSHLFSERQTLDGSTVLSLVIHIRSQQGPTAAAACHCAPDLFGICPRNVSK